MPRDHVQITNGVVLAQPHLCPPYVYELMLRCWTESASARLPIQGVVTELTSMTSNPAFDVQVRTYACVPPCSSHAVQPDAYRNHTQDPTVAPPCEVHMIFSC